MIKYIGLLLVLTFITSCKYREHKATYSIVEVDTVEMNQDENLNDLERIDTIDEAGVNSIKTK